MKNILRDITYGMYVVTSKDSGCVINTLTQVSSNNLVTISLNKDNYTNKVIKENKKFIVSIISEKTNPNIISTFGFRSSKDIDKFENFDYNIIDGTKVLNENMIGYIECEVIDIIDADTHDIFIAKILSTKKETDYTPMTYTYYHEVIKGTSPVKAPTYIEKTEEVYVCDVCGYVHKGPLSDDFVCPICGVDKSHFKKKEG